MRILMTSLIVLMAICCTNSNKRPVSKQKEAEFKTFFNETYKDLDSTITIDSFRFVRFDTLTLRDKYNTMIDYIGDDLKDINYDLENSLAVYKNKLQLASLSYGLSGSLYKNYKMDADDEKEKFDKLVNKSERLKVIADSIMKLRDKADSINASNYYAVCFYQIRRKNQTVKKDTAFLLLNLDKNVINRNEYYKYQ